MNDREFIELSRDLQNLASNIPVRWGKIQNNSTDSKLNMFKINSYANLEDSIRDFSDADKNYFRRRWFLWQSSKCDEYLFYKNISVTKNPNVYDQNYDVEFNGNRELRFDIKGTVIPKSFSNRNLNFFERNTLNEIIKFYYQQQSRGVRNNIQNRLFVIHHSEISRERGLLLRSNFSLKEEAFRKYSEVISASRQFFYYQAVKCDCIIIYETKEGLSKYFIFK